MTHRNAAAAEPTDLMHRRVPLALKAAYSWRGRAVLIETNSALVLRAAAEAGLMRIDDEPLNADLHWADLRWELTCEDSERCGGPLPASRFWSDGETLYFEIGREQWFAFDAKSGDGAGFASAGLTPAELRELIREIMKLTAEVLPGKSERCNSNG